MADERNSAKRNRSESMCMMKSPLRKSGAPRPCVVRRDHHVTLAAYRAQRQGLAEPVAYLAAQAVDEHLQAMRIEIARRRREQCDDLDSRNHFAGRREEAAKEPSLEQVQGNVESVRRVQAPATLRQAPAAA